MLGGGGNDDETFSILTVTKEDLKQPQKLDILAHPHNLSFKRTA